MTRKQATLVSVLADTIRKGCPDVELFEECWSFLNYHYDTTTINQRINHIEDILLTQRSVLSGAQIQFVSNNLTCLKYALRNKVI